MDYCLIADELPSQVPGTFYAFRDPDYRHMVRFEAATLRAKTEQDAAQAIQTATSNPAKVLGVQDQRGLVAEGLDADLLVVGGDLSADISRLEDVKLVLLGGERVFEDGVRYVGTSNLQM